MLSREYENYFTMTVNFSCNDVLYSQVVAQYLGYTQAFNVFYNLIHWPSGGTPPANMPRCGFSGELCVTYGKLQIMFNSYPNFPFFMIAQVIQYMITT